MKRSVVLSAFAALVLLQALFVYSYGLHEHTFYFWDHAMYLTLARGFEAVWQSGFLNGLVALQGSFIDNYNVLFALPSLATFAVFGDSRPVFLLTNFAVFFVAYEVALAFVLRRLFGFTWPLALLLGAGICCVIPPLWLPLVEGYPDVGAAACLVFAFGIALMPAERLRRAAAIGALLGFSFLFRRHFVYPALALLIVKAAFDFYADVWRADAASEGRVLRRFFSYYVLCGAGFLTVFILSPRFLLNALTTDYGSLYLSYKKPALVFLGFALNRFGLLLFAISAAGYVAAVRLLPEARRGLLLLAAATALWAVVWSTGPAQAGHHYLLHILPLFMAVGVCGFIVALLRQRKLPFALLGGGVVFVLAVNSAWALWLSPRGIRPNDMGPPGFFSAPRPPVVRQDYDALVALGKHIAATSGPGDGVYVVGSSFVFNQDLMRAVFTEALHREDVARRFVFAPEIDSSQSLPLNAFASATLYIVPDPPQYHLDPQGQRVVTAVAGQFPPPEERAGLFARDEAVFFLEDGVKLRVWRRKPWTPGALHDALTDVRKAGISIQQDWVMVTPLPQVALTTEEQGLAGLFARFDAGHAGVSLVFDVPLGAGSYRFSTRAAAQPVCRGPSLALTALTKTGDVLWEKRFTIPVEPGVLAHSFDMPSKPEQPGFLQLRLSADGIQPCVAGLRSMSVEKIQQ
jgi:hypothetical protein